MVKTKYVPCLEGEFRWTSGDDIAIVCPFDQVAISRGELMLLSVVASSGEIKALRAALSMNLKAAMKFSDAQFTLKELKDGSDYRVSSGQVFSYSGKYLTMSHKLGLGTLHGLFVARKPGLLFDEGETALWQELKDERFTTPLLRSWMPFVRQELIMRDRLTACKCFGCSCLILECTSENLDEIVSHGLENGHIFIREEEVA